MKNPETIATHERFAGRVFRVRTDELRYPDGSVHTADIVVHPGAFGIIATPEDRSIVLVRQYRHAVGRAIWEIPAGTAEPGESPAAGAARELREETGYSCESLRPLGRLFMTPGICTEEMYFFHATGLRPGEQQLDGDEAISVATVTLEDAKRLTAAREIVDAKTLLALLWMESERGELVPESGR